MWLRITPIPLAVAEFRWSHFKIVIRRIPGATAMVKLHAWARPRATTMPQRLAGRYTYLRSTSKERDP